MLSLTVVDHWSDTKRIHVTGTITASGNYPATGDAVPLTDPNIKTGSSPVYASIFGASAVYDYLAVLNGSGVPAMKVVTRSTGVELAAGAYPVGVTGDSIYLYAIFPKFI